jgi:hypothetical protein
MGFLFGHHKKDPNTNLTSANLNALAGQQAAYGKAAGDKGSATADKGQAAIDKVLNHFLTILSGDRDAATAELAPEVGAISDKYDAAKRLVSEFSPRGGGRTEALGDAEARKASDITNLISDERTKAADAVTGLGEFETGTGIQELATGAGNYTQRYTSPDEK